MHPGVASATDPFGLVGDTLAGRFRVERQVAEGGFGVVYRAQQLALDRAVALKVLKTPPALTAEQHRAFQAKFEAEARTIGRLKHPHIVEVYDFGVIERRAGVVLHWMALEWLEGRTLEAMLEERRSTRAPRMEPARVLELLRPVLQGMAFAHRERVAHCDLKPGNIFLVEAHGAVVPKVLDFGIATLLAGEQPAADGASGTATTRGFAAFSPDYAAPEQVTHGRTGPWTDVHALGLIITELVSGEPPYGTGPPHGEGAFDEVISLRRPTPGSKGVGVEGWERVLARALARSPADRHPDARALLDDLEQRLPRTPAATTGAPSPRRPRRVLPVLAGAVVVLAVLAVPLVRMLQPARAERTMVAVLPFENLTGDPAQEYFSDGLTEELIDQLGRLRPDRLAVIARTSVVHYKTWPRSVKEIGRELAVAYVLEGSVKRAGGRVRVATRLVQVSDETQIWSDTHDREVKDIVDLQSDIARAIAAGLRVKLDRAPARTVTVLDPAAYDAYLRGRFFLARWGDGRGTFMQAGPYLEKAIALAPDFAAAHAAFAEYLGPRGMELGARAKAAALRALELDETLPSAHRALANVLLAYEWDWTGAEGHYRRALALDPNDGQTHQLWARIPLTTGRFAEAIAARKSAVELSPLSWDAQVQLASAYYMARQYDEATAQLRRILAANPELGPAHLFLGAVAVHEHRYAEAMAEGSKCGMACNGRVTGPALARLGRSAEAIAAIEQLKRAIEHEAPMLANPQPSWSLEAARVYAALGRRDDAFACLERAVAERSRDLIFLRVDEQWDPLRADPRFDDLVRRVGIPPA